MGAPRACCCAPSTLSHVLCLIATSLLAAHAVSASCHNTDEIYRDMGKSCCDTKPSAASIPYRDIVSSVTTWNRPNQQLSLSRQQMPCCNIESPSLASLCCEEEKSYCNTKPSPMAKLCREIKMFFRDKKPTRPGQNSVVTQLCESYLDTTNFCRDMKSLGLNQAPSQP